MLTLNIHDPSIGPATAAVNVEFSLWALATELNPASKVNTTVAIMSRVTMRRLLLFPTIAIVVFLLCVRFIADSPVSANPTAVPHPGCG
jgi:hypothetical protein